MKPTLVVLAAGMGSRYGGLKQVDPVGPSGEAILDYSVFDAERAGFGKVVFIIRKDFEAEFKEKVGAKYEGVIPVDYCYQDIHDLPAPSPPMMKARRTPSAARAPSSRSRLPPSMRTTSTAATPSRNWVPSCRMPPPRETSCISRWSATASTSR